MMVFGEYCVSYYFILPITLLILIYSYCCYKLNYWKRKGVQQLRTTSKIFGDFKNGVLFRSPPGYHLGDLYREAPADAPYIGFYIFHKPCLLLKDPELIQHVMISDFKNFTNRYFAGTQQKDSIGVLNLFGVKNPAWSYLRRKTSATFNGSRLKQLFPLLMETAQPMVKYLKENVGDEVKMIDVQDVSFKYAGDLIGKVALGTDTDSFRYPDSEYSKFLMAFFCSFKRMVALVTVFFVPRLVELIGSPIFFDLSLARKLFWKSMRYREESGIKRGDYIDSMIQLKNGKQDPLYKFEAENLWYQSATFFSGFESSAIATSFALSELAMSKPCQERARADVKNAISKYGWTIEAFDAMKYLDQCIYETTRLHPSVSTLDRYTLEDYKLPNTDLIIEKGTPIYISLYGLHGDPKYFEKPHEFDPERFSNSGTVSKAYISFGVGPRKCLGEKLGHLHVKVVLALILSEYEIYQKPAEVRLDSRSTFTTAVDGINIEFTKLIHN